jgi:TonB family protein
LKQHLSGTVVVRFLVDMRGSVRDVQVVKSTTPGVFDGAVVTAVKRWLYQPALVNGKPVEAHLQLIMRFSPDIYGPPPNPGLAAGAVAPAAHPAGHASFDHMVEELKKQLASGP